MHIPKTGGTTITAFLHYVLSTFCKESVFPFVDSPSGNCSWVHPNAGPDGNHRFSFAHKQLTSTSPFRYAVGHLHFGFCQFLVLGCQYVTLLREPVSRFVSHYRYVQRHHPEILREICSDCLSLEHFVAYLQRIRSVAQPRARVYLQYGFDNVQTRMIAGDAFFISIVPNSTAACEIGSSICDVAPLVNRRMLATAKFNLAHHFSIAGIYERFDEFVSVFAQLLQADASSQPRLNSGPPAEPLPLSLRSAIADLEAYDVALYQLALRRWNAHVGWTEKKSTRAV